MAEGLQFRKLAKRTELTCQLDRTQYNLFCGCGRFRGLRFDPHLPNETGEWNLTKVDEIVPGQCEECGPKGKEDLTEDEKLRERELIPPAERMRARLEAEGKVV